MSNYVKLNALAWLPRVSQRGVSHTHCLYIALYILHHKSSLPFALCHYLAKNLFYDFDHKRHRNQRARERNKNASCKREGEQHGEFCQGTRRDLQSQSRRKGISIHLRSYDNTVTYIFGFVYIRYVYKKSDINIFL